MPLFIKKISPRLLWLAFIAFGLFGIFLLWKFDPITAGFFPPCIFHKVTNLYCPGCGATRACDALIAGDLSKAFGYNPLFMVCFPFVILFLIRSVWFGVMKNEEFEVPESLSKYLVVLAVVTVAYGVVRNLPSSPLS